MKIATAIGNNQIYEVIEASNLEIIDEINSLDALEEIVELMPMDGLLLNRLLDNEGKYIINIAKKAIKKHIKVIILIDDFEEKKLITSLVNEGVTAFIKLEEISIEKVESLFKNYPLEFDYGVFTTPEEQKIKIERVVESVFKEVITVYSPLSQGATTTATHLAYALASSKQCRVCIVDFNPLKPAFKKVFEGNNFEFTLTDVLDAVTRQNLTHERLEGFTKPFKLQTNLDILPGIYYINEYYASVSSQYKEVIEKLKYNYDYVIIDTHSWYDVLSTDIALKLADKVIVPLYGNRHDVEEVNRYMENFKKYNDFDTRKFSFLINRYSGNDLSYVELEAKLQNEIVGYISNHNIDKSIGNGFKDKKMINEYIGVLKKLEINVTKQKSIMEIFKRKVVGK